MDPTSARQLAERIYEHELREAGTADLVDVVKRTHQKLERAISPTMGEAGFAAMLTRTVQMVGADPGVQGLAALRADAVRMGLVASLVGQEPEAVRAIGVALLARFVVLLSTFIGTELALRLLVSTWPDAIAHAIEPAEKS